MLEENKTKSQSYRSLFKLDKARPIALKDKLPLGKCRLHLMSNFGLRNQNDSRSAMYIEWNFKTQVQELLI